MIDTTYRLKIRAISQFLFTKSTSKATNTTLLRRKILKKTKISQRQGSNMSQNETPSKSAANENEIKVIGYDEKDKAFVVKSSPMGHILKISDTFAETLTLMEISPAKSFFFCFLVRTLGRFLCALKRSKPSFHGTLPLFLCGARDRFQYEWHKQNQWYSKRRIAGRSIHLLFRGRWIFSNLLERLDTESERFPAGHNSLHSSLKR